MKCRSTFTGGKAVAYPPAVKKARLLTEYFFLRSAVPVASVGELRRRFTNRMVYHRRLVAYPLYSLESSCFEEYLEEKRLSGFLQGDSILSLTKVGHERLAMLEPKAKQLTRQTR